MPIKAVLSFLTLVLLVSAAPSRQVTCTKDRIASNAACCKWYEVLDDIQDNLFEHQCGAEAHEAVRLTFHDAIGFSATNPLMGGGADGSIMAWSEIETAYHANAGIDEVVEDQRPFALKHGVSFGDFIQFAGAVGISNCPGAPRLQFLAGRSNNSFPALDHTVPLPSDSVDQMIQRMGDAGFTADELVDLLASHSIAIQTQVDRTVPPRKSLLDSTPSTFDAQFYVETLLKGVSYPGNGSHMGEAESPFPGEFRLQSDAVLARDTRTACEWQSFVNNQDLMATKFAKAMAKLAVVGHDPISLVDCSEVIPTPRTLSSNTAHFPTGKSKADIEASCPSTPFPDLPMAST